jgi:hypothetical protein
LNRCDTFGENTSEFLYLLYERVLTTDWLRVVLDGMKGDVSGNLSPRAIRHLTAAIQEDQVLAYLRRRLQQLGETFAEKELKVVARGAFGDYTDAAPAEALNTLVRRVVKIVNDYLTV